MSCGRNRRRTKISSKFTSPSIDRHSFSMGNTQLEKNFHQTSYSRISAQKRNSLEQPSQQNIIDLNQFRVKTFNIISSFDHYSQFV